MWTCHHLTEFSVIDQQASISHGSFDCFHYSYKRSLVATVECLYIMAIR